MAAFYLYLSRFASPKCLLKKQFSRGGFLKYMKCVIRCHYSINENEIMLCDNTSLCDEGQTELLGDSPNFDGDVGID